MRLLLVEDDSRMGRALHMGLSSDGKYTTDWVQTAQQAQLALQQGDVDFVLLDINLPDGSGLEVLKNLRRQNNPAFVMIISSNDDLTHRVEGLNSGADDYMVKPFDYEELLARIQAVHRRGCTRLSEVICYRDIELDLAAKSVMKEGQVIPLSAREFAIFSTLLSNQGRIFSQQHLENKLYGWSEAGSSNAIEVHISHLRKKFGKDLITTVRGMGYVINKLTH